MTRLHPVEYGHCLPLTRCRASLAVLQLSIIRLLEYDWLSEYWRIMNIVTCAIETRFLNIYSTFFIAANELMLPKYDYSICKHLFCIHAKFYKHISPIHYKLDIQSLKFCCKCSYWFFSQFIIQGNHPQLKVDIDHIAKILFAFYSEYCSCENLSEKVMIFELFPGQIMWRARNKWKFLTFYIKCAISRTILEILKNE